MIRTTSNKRLKTNHNYNTYPSSIFSPPNQTSYLVAANQSLFVHNNKLAKLAKELKSHCVLAYREYNTKQSKYESATELVWRETNDGVYTVFPRYLANICLSAQQRQTLAQGHLLFDMHDEIKKKKLQFVGELIQDRKRQKDASDAIYTSLLQDGGAVLCLPPGTGKTTVACHVISRISTPTVVLVHTSELAKQWVERVNQYLPEAVVGVFSNSKPIRASEYDIIVATLQTMSLEHTPVQAGVGLVIVDEAHHICATMLRQALDKFNASYTLGLTATPDRKDDRTPFLFWALGPLAFELKVPYDLPVSVHTIVYHDTSIAKHEDKFYKLNQHLCKNIHRIHAVLSLAFEIVPNVAQRNILVLATRKEVRDEAYSYIQKNLCAKYGISPDNVMCKQSELQKSQKDLRIPDTNKILLCTNQLVSEGFDRPQLDTLIHLMPTGEAIQTYGRVMRSSKKKNLPIYVIEIDDCDSKMLHAMYVKRTNTVFGSYGTFTEGEITRKSLHITRPPLSKNQIRLHNEEKN